jgi:hypothetical protein
MCFALKGQCIPAKGEALELRCKLITRSEGTLHRVVAALCGVLTERIDTFATLAWFHP